MSNEGREERKVLNQKEREMEKVMERVMKRRGMEDGRKGGIEGGKCKTVTYFIIQWCCLSY